MHSTSDILRYPELFECQEAERLNFLQTINADWLPYINGETNKRDQQNQTAQLTNDAEPTATKTSQCVVGVSHQTYENGNSNKDNDSKAALLNELKRQKILRL